MNTFSIVLIRCSFDELPCRVFLNDHAAAIRHAAGIVASGILPVDIQDVLQTDASEPCNVGVLRMVDGRPTDWTTVAEWNNGEGITVEDRKVLDELFEGATVEELAAFGRQASGGTEPVEENPVATLGALLAEAVSGFVNLQRVRGKTKEEIHARASQVTKDFISALLD